ncbi:hypothetical protein JHK86_005223 [Glycine max]|nr:hypothetical protein JHK86_005223 [Glycine max]
MTQLNHNSKFEPFSSKTELPGLKYHSFKDFVLFKSTESACNEILKALIKDKSFHMIGHHGMGGSGKTTLVKEVGKKVEELKLFEKVVMATLNLLTGEEAWDLFELYATIADNSSAALKVLATKIVNECKRLPIAIVTLGSTLRGKTLEEGSWHYQDLKILNHWIFQKA